MEVALFKPEIPPNTGNIGRLCVNSGVPLSIIGEPAFDLSEKAARRAGLDYWQHLELNRYKDWDEFIEAKQGKRIFLVSKFGTKNYAKVCFREGDVLVFGQETKGLPASIRENWMPDRVLFIPMKPISRSINLSNSVAIILFESLRQIGNWSENTLH
ncbi:MAG: tRNA (cytidine(34)-2'-O)-methyltransferase [Leptospira sp.]|nr:tRNA (cytidine(34)-2'-O)-methyltransferase [Leptospira sp.]